MPEQSKKILFYLKDYIPKWVLDIKNDQDVFSTKVLKFKNKEKKYIDHFAKRTFKKYKFIDQFNFTFTRAPSSNTNNIANSCLIMIDQIMSLSKQQHENGSLFLRRYTSIDPQHKSQKKRSIEMHLESIDVDLNFYPCIKNKNIILFDDIYTTGCTIEACTNLLFEHHAKKVIQIVLGKTK